MTQIMPQNRHFPKPKPINRHSTYPRHGIYNNSKLHPLKHVKNQKQRWREVDGRSDQLKLFAEDEETLEIGCVESSVVWWMYGKFELMMMIQIASVCCVGIFFDDDDSLWWWIWCAKWFRDAETNHAWTGGDESGEEMKADGDDMEEHAELEWSAVVAGIVDDALREGEEWDDQGGGESGLFFFLCCCCCKIIISFLIVLYI